MPVVQLSSRLNRMGGRRGRVAILAVVMLLTFAAGATGAQAATLTVGKVTNPAGDATMFTFHVAFKALPGDTPPAVSSTMARRIAAGACGRARARDDSPCAPVPARSATRS